MFCRAVLVVKAEIADAHELEGRRVYALTVFHPVVFGRDAGEILFDLAVLQNDQAVGIHRVEEVLVGAVRVRIAEQVVVEPHFGVDGRGRVHPVERRPLHLPSVGGIAAAGGGIVGAEDLFHLAGFIFPAARAGHEVGAL